MLLDVAATTSVVAAAAGSKFLCIVDADEKHYQLQTKSKLDLRMCKQSDSRSEYIRERTYSFKLV